MEDTINTKEFWSIDRIEDGVAVLESDGKGHIEIGAEELPPDTREGDMLTRLSDGQFLPDQDETAKRRKKNLELFKALLERQGSVD